MEGEVVTLQDAFLFDYGAGLDANGEPIVELCEVSNNPENPADGVRLVLRRGRDVTQMFRASAAEELQRIIVDADDAVKDAREAARGDRLVGLARAFAAPGDAVGAPDCAP